MRQRFQFHVKTGVTGVPSATLSRLVIPFAVKADAVDAEARTFEGLLAVWDKDLGDDVIHKGAFKNTIKEWKKSKDAMPLLNSHNHFDIFSTLGQALEMEETDEGLNVKWEVLEGADGDETLVRLRPSARTKRAVISKMSIGYEPIKWEMEASDESRWGQIRHLKEVSLKEGSLVLFPMAPGARIDPRSVKVFMDSALRVDPKTVDDDTKIELRRLATRIGLLLKPQAKDGDPPPVSDPPVPVVDPAPSPNLDPDPAPAPVGDPAPAPITDPTPDPIKQEQPIYLYGEALQQRLKGTLLKAKVSTIINPNK